jgi:hypothetical protein
VTDEAAILVSGPSGSVRLTVSWSTTVGELFDQARTQLGLGGPDAYELWCGDGVTMMNKLERSLQELRDRRICAKREFAIRPVG